MAVIMVLLLLLLLHIAHKNKQIDFLPHDITEPDWTQNRVFTRMPTPLAARSKAWVCGHSLAGIAGSNPAGGMDVCLL
jgi:hypothetical protein